MSDENEMDLKKVKELIQLMIEHDLVEAEVCEGKSKIHLKRPAAIAPVVTQMQSAPVPIAAAPALGTPPTQQAPASEPIDDGLDEIVSPIIGTFYAAASPDSDPYTSVGDRVTPDTVVCIIEAMKVMNEIKAEVSGTVAEVLCQAGQAVEFGQPLFKVKAD